MLSLVLSSMGIIGAFLLVVLCVGVVVAVLFQAVDNRRPEIPLALLIVAVLAYYVGMRVGGVP